MLVLNLEGEEATKLFFAIIQLRRMRYILGSNEIPSFISDKIATLRTSSSMETRNVIVATREEDPKVIHVS